MNNRIKKQFGENAEKYVKSAIHSRGEDLQKLIQLAAATGTEKVLDIATGGGHVANGLAPFVKHVSALDITEEMLEVAEGFIKGNKHTNVSFLLGDAENLPFSNDEFDIVTCRIAAHHFSNIDAFIKEVYRVLKPGGVFLFIDNVSPERDDFDSFYNEIEKRRDSSHVRAWRKSEWIKLIELNGFKIADFYVFEKTFDFNSWSERMNMTEADKNLLNDYMRTANRDTILKFKISSLNEKIQSFSGEAILLKGIK